VAPGSRARDQVQIAGLDLVAGRAAQFHLDGLTAVAVP
jgi:hypothetical protein